MIIRVGGKYVTRSNQIVHITNTQNLGVVTTFSGDNKQTYWGDGKHYAGDPQFDLLYETAHSSIAEPTKPKMKLEVGKVYLKYDNAPVLISNKDIFKGKTYYIGDNQENYWEDGGSCNQVKELDLVSEYKPQPKTEILGYHYHQLHPDFIRRVSKIYHEGSKKYGKDNYKQGFKDTAFLDERFNHVMDHLLRYREGDRTEDHLAKIAWWACFMMQSESANQSNQNGTTNQSDSL